MKIRLGRWPSLILLGLLLGGYVLMGRAMNPPVPQGAALRMWPTLEGDLRALGLNPARVSVGVHVTTASLSPPDTPVPMRAEYMVYRVKAARLKLPARWQDQGIPERPKIDWLGSRRRRGRGGGDCAQQIGGLLSPWQHVETADVIWTEGMARAQERVTLRVWRARATFLPSVAGGRVCVQASRQPLGP